MLLSNSHIIMLTVLSVFLGGGAWFLSLAVSNVYKLSNLSLVVVFYGSFLASSVFWYYVVRPFFTWLCIFSKFKVKLSRGEMFSMSPAVLPLILNKYHYWSPKAKDLSNFDESYKKKYLLDWSVMVRKSCVYHFSPEEWGYPSQGNIKMISELTSGQLIIHSDEGVGRFQNEIEEGLNYDFQIEYIDGNTLYFHLSSLGKLSHYSSKIEKYGPCEPLRFFYTITFAFLVIIFSVIFSTVDLFGNTKSGFLGALTLSLVLMCFFHSLLKQNLLKIERKILKIWRRT